LSGKGLTAHQLQEAATAVMPIALSASLNVGNFQKEERQSAANSSDALRSERRNTVINEAERVLQMEHNLALLVDDWAETQRRKLNEAKASLKIQSSRGELISYVLFGIGFLLTLAEKLAGKEADGAEVLKKQGEA
jgi:hypothetical protein